jgi:hypothetical protein
VKAEELHFCPRVLRLPLAELYVGGQQNLRALVKAGWVAPLIKHKSNTSFDVQDLDHAIDRLKMVGWDRMHLDALQRSSAQASV